MYLWTAQITPPPSAGTEDLICLNVQPPNSLNRMGGVAGLLNQNAGGAMRQDILSGTSNYADLALVAVTSPLDVPTQSTDHTRIQDPAVFPDPMLSAPNDYIESPIWGLDLDGKLTLAWINSDTLMVCAASIKKPFLHLVQRMVAMGIVAQLLTSCCMYPA